VKPDQRIAIVEAALKAASIAIVTHEATIAEGVAIVSAAMSGGDAPAEITPRESALTARRAWRERILDVMALHEREGRGREAAMLTARQFAADPLDPIEVESLAARCRRWRRKNKLLIVRNAQKFLAMFSRNA
jgi:hypothetical protein